MLNSKMVAGLIGQPNGIEAVAGAIRQKYVSDVASFA